MSSSRGCARCAPSVAACAPSRAPPRTARTRATTVSGSVPASAPAAAAAAPLVVRRGGAIGRRRAARLRATRRRHAPVARESRYRTTPSPPVPIARPARWRRRIAKLARADAVPSLDERPRGSTTSCCVVARHRVVARRALIAACHGARELLAGMLDYHRRENKPVWWRRFEWREAPVAELIDDERTLGGLRRTATPPRAASASRAHAPMLEFSFDQPRQMTKLAAGDAVVVVGIAPSPADGAAGGAAGELRAKIAALDARRGRVELEMSAEPSPRDERAGVGVAPTSSSTRRPSPPRSSRPPRRSSRAAARTRTAAKAAAASVVLCRASRAALRACASSAEQRPALRLGRARAARSPRR